jgi:hypothetical protein
MSITPSCADPVASYLVNLLLKESSSVEKTFGALLGTNLYSSGKVKTTPS